MRRKVVNVASNCHRRIANAKGDPYKGHGVEPDELQQAWKKSIRVVQEERKRDLRLSSATERIERIRQRVRVQGVPTDSSRANAALARFIHNENTWLCGRQAAATVHAAAVHPACTIGNVLLDEANGHHLRICETDTGSRWIWCYKCGAHTRTRIRSLAEQCKGSRNIAQKRRLENSCDPYTNRRNGGQPRDMAWSDVDAVRILDECRKISQVACATQDSSECDTAHYGQCPGGSSVGPTAVDEDVVVPGGGSVLDDDDVCAAMQCIA